MDLKMIIGGKRSDASDGARIAVLNPSAGNRIGSVPCATPEDVKRAMMSAAEGQRRWYDVPLYQKIEIFDRYGALIRERREELAGLVCSESGRLYRDALDELDLHAYLFKVYGENARKQQVLPDSAEIEADTGDAAHFTVDEPIGVIACMIPHHCASEFFACKIAPALIMGNAVVIIPPEEMPLGVIRFAELLLEAGVDKEAVQLVSGKREIFAELLANGRLADAVCFYRELPSGPFRMLQDGNGTCLLPESASNNALIVFDDCSLDEAVRETILERTANAGQADSAVRRILVDSSILDAFVKKLVREVKKIKTGDPMDVRSDMGPMISPEAAEQTVRFVEEAVRNGAECVLGGTRQGAYMEPTVLTGISSDMHFAENMIVSGPVIPVIGFDSPEEAVRICNSGFCSGYVRVMTGDVRLAMGIVRQLKCDAVMINSRGNNRYIHPEFGGYRENGISRSVVRKGLAEMVRTKIISLYGSRE